MDGPSLQEFFEPSSVAIIGASKDPGKLGHEVMKNILAGRYSGQVFPVNPRTPEILGIKTYPSVAEIPSSVDLAVIVVPSTVVPTVMDECAMKRVKASIIISGGFREVGEHGRELEKALLETARKAGIRIIGPNCQGVNTPQTGLCATVGYFARRSGPIAVVAQSGTVAGAIQCWADREGVGISKCVNLGNKIDVNETDIIQYLKDDPDTKVIALHLEGVTNGRAFMRVAAEASKVKPIVALKGGTTEAGSKAMLSHTSSLAGRSEIFDAALKQTGIMKADTLEELYDIAKAFSFLSLPKGRGVMIVESTGGAGVLVADMCEKLGLKLPEPTERAKNRLRETLSSVCTFSNPFDLASESLVDDRFRLVIEENMNNDEFQSFIAIFGDPIAGAAEQIKEASEKTHKPIVVAYFGGGEIEDRERAKMYSIGIPVFPSPERAVVALHALVKYSELLERTKHLARSRVIVQKNGASHMLNPDRS